MTDRSLVVVHVLSSCLGGASNHVYDLIQNTTVPCRYYVFIPDDGGAFLERIKALPALTVIVLPIDRKPTLKVLIKMVGCLREINPDIVHCHGYRAGLVGRISAKLASRRIKTILTVHGFHYFYYSNSFKRHLFLLLERLLQGFTDFVIAVSPTDLRNLIQTNNASSLRSRCILCGLNISEVTRIEKNTPSIRKRLNIPTETINIIGSVGRLHYQKGLDNFLYAIPAILKQCPLSMFIIVGDGPERIQLESVAQTLGIAEKVIFCGHLPNVLEVLACFDVFVFPSLWEGMPVGLLEAMLLSVPIVTTDVDGNRDIMDITQNNGLIVPPNNSDALAVAIVSLLRGQYPINPSDMSSSIRIIKEKFTIPRLVNETFEVYTKLTICCPHLNVRDTIEAYK